MKQSIAEAPEDYLVEKEWLEDVPEDAKEAVLEMDQESIPDLTPREKQLVELSGDVTLNDLEVEPWSDNPHVRPKF
ncbi:MAG: hypothetical protein K9K66_14585 [Desulfarculaceae bacterium]|nr:hypothetical protein [Desulfarculaceae bacterium]MCF8102880.1 hypothetical protein [Desulfarculaceae bacterium]MCF8118462.1 hypothetical protein [Desulfarculaceae bacterium]